MPGTKTLRGNVTIWAVRPEAFTDWTQPISLAAWDTALANGLINDISVAVEDSYKLAASGSKTDNSMSVVDIAQVDNPLYSNYTATLDLFRNKPGTTDSPAYDIALSLFDGVGIAYYLVLRTDKAQGSAVEVGDILSSFGVTTDYLVDSVADGSMILANQVFKPTGDLHPYLTVVA